MKLPPFPNFDKLNMRCDCCGLRFSLEGVHNANGIPKYALILCGKQCASRMSALDALALMP